MYNKLKKRKGAYVFVLVLSVFVLAVVSLILFAQYASSLSKTAIFHSEQYSFSVQYPAGWEVNAVNAATTQFIGPRVGGNNPYAGSPSVSIEIHSDQTSSAYIKSLDVLAIPGPDTKTLRSFTIGSHEAVEIVVNDGDGGGHRELLVSTPSGLLVAKSRDAFVGEPQAYDLISNSLRFD